MPKTCPRCQAVHSGIAVRCDRCGSDLTAVTAVGPVAPALAPPERVGGVGDGLLTFGQVVSVVSCVLTPVVASGGFVLAVKGPDPAPGLWVLVGAVSAFAYSAAMFVVFSRVKQLPGRPSPPQQTGGA